MKHILFFLSATLFLITGFAQDFLVTTPIQVPESMGNHHPQIEIIEPGRVGITWTSAGTKNIFFAKHNGIDGFSDPIQLNPDGLDVQSYDWSGPDLAVEGDNVYVVFRSYGYETGNIYLVKSTDKGETFGAPVQVDALMDGFAQYPDVAVFNDTVYVTFMTHDAGGGNPTYDIARSVDGGLTFETEVLGATIVDGEACDCCQPDIIVNDAYVLVFFRNNDENIRDIKGILSTDRGASFTDWISVDDHNWYIEACPSTGPDARFISDSELVATYKTEVDDQGKVFLNVYNLDTDASSDLVEIKGTIGVASSVNYPQVCYDDGQIGLVWEEVSEGTSLDVFFNHSSTEDIDFDPSNAINLTNLHGVQAKPDITLDNGVFHVVYADVSDFKLYYLQIAQANNVDENELDFEARYLPNSNQIFVNYGGDDKAQITVTDLMGRIILDDQLSTGETYIDAGSWNASVYVITIRVEDVRAVKKIVR